MNAGSFGDYRIRLTAQLSLSRSLFTFLLFSGVCRGARKISPAFAGFHLGVGAVCCEFEIAQSFVPPAGGPRGIRICPMADSREFQICRAPGTCLLAQAQFAAERFFTEAGRGSFAEFAKKRSGPPRAGGFSAMPPSGRGDCAPRMRAVFRFLEKRLPIAP